MSDAAAIKTTFPNHLDIFENLEWRGERPSFVLIGCQDVHFVFARFTVAGKGKKLGNSVDICISTSKDDPDNDTPKRRFSIDELKDINSSWPFWSIVFSCKERWETYLRVFIKAGTVLHGDTVHAAIKIDAHFLSYLRSAFEIIREAEQFREEYSGTLEEGETIEKRWRIQMQEKRRLLLQKEKESQKKTNFRRRARQHIMHHTVLEDIARSKQPDSALERTIVVEELSDSDYEFESGNAKRPSPDNPSDLQRTSQRSNGSESAHQPSGASRNTLTDLQPNTEKLFNYGSQRRPKLVEKSGYANGNVPRQEQIVQHTPMLGQHGSHAMVNSRRSRSPEYLSASARPMPRGERNGRLGHGLPTRYQGQAEANCEVAPEREILSQRTGVPLAYQRPLPTHGLPMYPEEYAYHAYVHDPRQDYTASAARAPFYSSSLSTYNGLNTSSAPAYTGFKTGSSSRSRSAASSESKFNQSPGSGPDFIPWHAYRPLHAHGPLETGPRMIKVEDSSRSCERDMVSTGSLTSEVNIRFRAKDVDADAVLINSPQANLNLNPSGPSRPPAQRNHPHWRRHNQKYPDNEQYHLPDFEDGDEVSLQAQYATLPNSDKLPDRGSTTDAQQEKANPSITKENAAAKDNDDEQDVREGQSQPYIRWRPWDL